MKLANHHSERVRKAAIEKHAPLKGDRYANRKMLSQLGSEFDEELPKDLSLKEKEEAMMETARGVQAAAAEFMRWQDMTEDAIREELAEKRSNELNQPFEEELAIFEDEDVADSLNQYDVDALEQLASNLMETRSYIEQHEHELEALLTKEDWLKIYSKSITDFGLDMDHLIRRNSHRDSYMEDLENDMRPIDIMN